MERTAYRQFVGRGQYIFFVKRLSRQPTVSCFAVTVTCIRHETSVPRLFDGCQCGSLRTRRKSNFECICDGELDHYVLQQRSVHVAANICRPEKFFLNHAKRYSMNLRYLQYRDLKNGFQSSNGADHGYGKRMSSHSVKDVCF